MIVAGGTARFRRDKTRLTRRSTNRSGIVFAAAMGRPIAAIFVGPIDFLCAEVHPRFFMP